MNVKSKNCRGHFCVKFLLRNTPELTCRLHSNSLRQTLMNTLPVMMNQQKRAGIAQLVERRALGREVLCSNLSMAVLKVTLRGLL